MNDLQTEVKNVKIYCNCKSNIAGLNTVLAHRFNGIYNQFIAVVSQSCRVLPHPNVFTLTLIDSNNE